MWNNSEEELVLDLAHPGLHQAVEDFYGVIAGGNEVLVQRCMELFRMHLDDEGMAEEFEEDEEGFFDAALIYGGNDLLMFSIDWKDTPTLIQQLKTLLRNHGCSLRLVWSHKNPVGRLTALQILGEAHQQLAPHGLQVWHWETGSDSVRGWLARTADADSVREKIGELGLVSGYPEEFMLPSPSSPYMPNA